METLELIQRLSIALAVGLLIGLERGWKARAEPEGGRAAGLRTHALSAFLGAIWAAVAMQFPEAGAIALGLAFVAFAAAMTVFRLREAIDDETFGATTLVAVLLSFVIGAYAIVGNTQVAAAAGVTVAVLLALKTFLHAWVRRLSWTELRSALVLLAMTFILLPLLPNRTIDPWGALNPFALWLMTILIAALSFAGYAAIKLLGDRAGILVTALAGGLASSTATTLTLARHARTYPERAGPLAGGVLLAGATMVARILLVVGIVNASLLAILGLPLIAGGLVLAGSGLFLLLNPSDQPEAKQDAIVLTNPFELQTVLGFGALLAVVSVLSRVVTTWAGNIGAFVLAAVSGLADVDAITISMASVGMQTIGSREAALAIAIAAGVNTAVKVGLGWMSGGSELGWRLAVATFGALLAAGLALGLTPAG